MLSCLTGGPGFGGTRGETRISGWEDMVRSLGYNCDLWSGSRMQRWWMAENLGIWG